MTGQRRFSQFAWDQGEEPEASGDGLGQKIPSDVVMRITAAVQLLCFV